VLQPLGPEHAPALFASLSDPETYRFIPSEPPASLEAIAARCRRIAAGSPDPSERWYTWAVARRDEESPFGTVELTLGNDGERALLAYVLARERWGEGYAYEACQAALEFLRAGTPVSAVAALIDTRNARSIALIERLGFVRAATIQDADYFKGATSHEYRYCRALAKDDHGETEQR
jgi:ribosomal-protein-alanine N-acetyltransferase